MPKFKYSDLLTQVQECPPPDAAEADRLAFRFVFNPVDARSFEIPANEMPTRFANNPCCSDCGLSMFTTEGGARAYFVQLLAKYRNIKMRTGDHLAEIVLTPTHGVQTKSEDDGHFDLHEYEAADLVAAATLMGPL